MSLIHFSEYEAFTEAIRDTNTDFMMPKLNTPKWAIQQTKLDDFSVQYGDEGGGNIAQGTVKPGGILIYVQLTGTWGTVEGQPASAAQIVVMDPESEFCVACPDAHAWFSVFVPSRYLFSEANSDGMGSFDGAKRVSLHHDRVRVHHLWELAKSALEADRVEPDILDQSAYRSSIQQAFVKHARSLLSVNPPKLDRSMGRPALSRCQILGSIHNWMENTSPSEQSKVDLKKLSSLADASERTLRSVFVERYGVPPAKYLRLCRFHQARASLRAARDPKQTVALIAAENGFWDFGRFAIEYRKLFGERPSETLGKNFL